MAEITNADQRAIPFQSDVDAFPLDENFNNYRNRHNQLNAAVNAITTAASGAETSGGRLYHPALNDRLDSGHLGQFNFIKVDGQVLERGTPDLNVLVKAIQAKVGGVDTRKGFSSWTRSGATVTITEENHGRSNGNIIKVDVTSSPAALALGEFTIAGVTTNTFTVTGGGGGATSGTAEFSTLLGPVVAADPSEFRFDVVVINSDNSIAILSGSSDPDPILPIVSSTQKALAILSVDDSTTSLNDGVEIIEARDQGCVFFQDGALKSQWKIQDAIDDIDATIGGVINIGRGSYHEQLILTAKSNITLNFETGAKVFRVSDSAVAIKAINTVSNEETNIHIIGGDLRGNGKAGANELLRLEFVDKSIVTGTLFDGNTSSTATNKEMQIENCDDFNIYNVVADSTEIGSVTTGPNKIHNQLELTLNRGKATLSLSNTAADVGLTIGGNTNLYRATADVLKTDAQFDIGFNGGKDTLNISSSGTDTGLSIAGNTNLFRDAVNSMRSDNDWGFAGSLSVDDGYRIGNSFGNLLHANNTTENAVFDALSPQMPTTGDKLIVNGGIADSGATTTVTSIGHAVRTSATVITFFGYDATTGTVNTFIVTDGDATANVDVSIAW